MNRSDGMLLSFKSTLNKYDRKIKPTKGWHAVESFEIISKTVFCLYTDKSKRELKPLYNEMSTTSFFINLNFRNIPNKVNSNLFVQHTAYILFNRVNNSFECQNNREHYKCFGRQKKWNIIMINAFFMNNVDILTRFIQYFVYLDGVSLFFVINRPRK